MENLKFEGSTIEQCIKNASDTLHIPVENIIYTVLEEKKGLFRKKAVISVQVNIACEDKNDGRVAVKSGMVVVKNPNKDGKPATIIPSQNIKLIVDGEEIKSRHEVLEESKIEVVFNESEAKRHLDLHISDDKMAVYVDIDYKPQTIYRLKDKEESCSLTLEEIIEKEIYPPIFTKKEINDELSKFSIKYGIIEDALNKCSTEKIISNLLIAKGEPPKDDVDDSLDLKFDTSSIVDGFSEDENGRVDYRNVGSVHSVEADTIIAVKKDGHEGADGKDVFGKIVKKKNRRIIDLRCGEGCTLKDTHTVISTIKGKPCIKNNTFYVYAVHEVQQDVDIKTGNVKFSGDVKIYGGVCSGMTVEAGNTVHVENNIENAKIEAKGNIEVKGNVLASTLIAGGQDVLLLHYIDNMKELKLALNNVSNTIMEIKKFNLLGQDKTDGEIIKVLIENKFRNITKLCAEIISMNKIIDNRDRNMVVQSIREKLIGMAPLEIKHFSDLDDIVICLDNEMNEVKNHVSLPVNIRVSYTQDSTIDSSGDIYITGKGDYVSCLNANGSIVFTLDKSVARGGTLTAKKEIRCKIVGSEGGVTTRLAVDEKGHIWADVAYQNTLLCVGPKEHMLEKASKNIHAYLDDKGDLIVDRLNL